LQEENKADEKSNKETKWCVCTGKYVAWSKALLNIAGMGHLSRSGNLEATTN